MLNDQNSSKRRNLGASILEALEDRTFLSGDPVSAQLSAPVWRGGGAPGRLPGISENAQGTVEVIAAPQVIPQIAAQGAVLPEIPALFPPQTFGRAMVNGSWGGGGVMAPAMNPGFAERAALMAIFSPNGMAAELVGTAYGFGSVWTSGEGYPGNFPRIEPLPNGPGFPGNYSQPPKTTSTGVVTAAAPSYAVATPLILLAPSRNVEGSVLSEAAAMNMQSGAAPVAIAKTVSPQPASRAQTFGEATFEVIEQSVAGGVSAVAMVQSEAGAEFASYRTVARHASGLTQTVVTTALTQKFLISEAYALARVANSAAARIYAEDAMIWKEMAAFLGAGIFISTYGASKRSSKREECAT